MATMFINFECVNFKVSSAEIYICECFASVSQVQWQFEHNGIFEAYPQNINMDIEKAYKEKKDEVTWTEESGDYLTEGISPLDRERSSIRSVPSCLVCPLSLV